MIKYIPCTSLYIYSFIYFKPIQTELQTDRLFSYKWKADKAKTNLRLQLVLSQKAA